MLSVKVPYNHTFTVHYLIYNLLRGIKGSEECLFNNLSSFHYDILSQPTSPLFVPSHPHSQYPPTLHISTITALLTLGLMDFMLQ